jgi:hypothetical protein
MRSRIAREWASSEARPPLFLRCLSVVLAVVFLVVIPEGDLLLFLPLFVPAVILSAAKDPGTLRTFGKNQPNQTK